MSLSALLLGGESAVKASKKRKQKEQEPAVSIDDGLDALFKSSVRVHIVMTLYLTTDFAQATIAASSAALAAVTAPGIAKVSKRKRKADADEEANADVTAASTPSSSSAKKAKKEKKEKPSDVSAPLPDPSEPLDAPTTKDKKTKSKKASSSQHTLLPSATDDEAEDATLTATEPSTSSSKKNVPTPQPEAASDGDDDDEEGDPSTLVHESLSGKPLPSNSRKKYVPEGETPAQRDERTIFIGNIPLEVAKNRVRHPFPLPCVWAWLTIRLCTQPMQKQLKRHVLVFVPGAKIESVRFRSLAFQKPTAQLPGSDDEGAKPKPAPASAKDGRAHDQARAASWRAAQPDRDESALAQDAKKFLRTEEKKKIAFIKGELHEGAQTANAYVVFAHARPGAPSDAEAGTAPLDPYEAARMAIREANGSVFMERTIRVDRAGKPAGAADTAATDDPKRTVFVGNLDFGSQEEDLRAFFEGVVSAERGPPVDAEDGDEDGAAKRPAGWVVRVRIVRDKDTQLGKGFAYVQFVVSAPCFGVYGGALIPPRRTRRASTRW
jgi:nucleolar protein 12